MTNVPRHSLPFLALALIVGCRTAQVAATTDAEALLRAVESGYRSTPDMALEGTVRVSGVPATIWVDGLMRGRDSMKITLTGPFAIPLGAMSATRTAFEFYKADEDIILYGTPDRRTFEKLLMIPLDYDELISLLRGEIPRVPQAGEYQVRADGELLHFTVRFGDRVEEIAVDQPLKAVRSYRRLRLEPDTLLPELEVTYSGFASFGGRQLARRAAVDVAGGAQRINVTIDRVEATIPDDASLALDMPAGVERHLFRP
jgi:hypothetical protein